MSATERLLAMLDDGRMSRTDLDPATLAASLRRMVGDGSVEWVTEPMQTRVLLDVADMLDENAKLREERDMYRDLVGCMVHPDIPDQLQAENAKLRELVRESLMDYRQYAEKYGLPPYLSDVNEHLDARLRDLGIEVDE